MSAKHRGKTTSEPEARLLMTILAVGDLERSARFYREAFGWPVEFETPVVVKFDASCGHELMLYQRVAFGGNTGQVPESVPENAISGTELYFHVDDLDQMISNLEAAGASVLSARSKRTWGDEAAYFADPDGNVLAVGRPLE